MTADITDLAGGWPETRFDRGDDLAGLAQDDFTGLLTAEGARLAMVNGRVVSSDASPDEFDDRSGTAHEAPNAVYPLLYAMREADGSVEAQYFTEKTSFEEADDKLSGGDFSGYIELSEDVLSGDYYAVYYGDRTMYVGFLGDGEIVTGDEAFDRANDEVGLYEVISADLDITELDTGSDDEPADEDESSVTESVAETDTDLERDSEPSPDQSAEQHASEPVTDTEPEVEADDSTPDPEPEGEESVDDTSEDASDSIPGPSVDDFDGTDAVGSVDLPDAVADEIADESDEPDESDDSASIDAVPDDSDGEDDAEETSVDDATVTSTPDADADLGEIRAQLDRVADRVGANETGVQNLQNQIAQLAERLDAVETRNQQLAQRLEEVEESGATDGSAADETPSGEPMEPEDALGQTDLFARHASKAEPTLADAMDDPELRDDAVDNLQFEMHTRFDREGVIVDDEPFEDFLAGTLERRLADWLVTELVYDLEDTGNDEALAGIYEVLSEIDRFDIRGRVDVGEDGDGAPFDVVVRNQRGQPLIVADTNNTHDPVGESDVSTLVEKASTVCTEHDTLGGALYVTESFFESGALELADGETGGGFFSSRKGWVKLARKQGYHLCLVEGRREAFHVTLPEM